MIISDNLLYFLLLLADDLFDIFCSKGIIDYVVDKFAIAEGFLLLDLSCSRLVIGRGGELML